MDSHCESHSIKYDLQESLEKQKFADGYISVGEGGIKSTGGMNWDICSTAFSSKPTKNTQVPWWNLSKKIQIFLPILTMNPACLNYIKQYLKGANLCDTKAETSPSFICNFKSVVNILEETTVFEYNRENLPSPSFEAVFRHPRVKNPGNARTTIPGFSLAWEIKSAENLESESQVNIITQNTL